MVLQKHELMKRIVFEVQNIEEFISQLKEMVLPEIRALFRDELAKANNESDNDLMTAKQGMDWLGKSLNSFYDIRDRWPELFEPVFKDGWKKPRYPRKSFNEAGKLKGWIK